MAKIGIFFGTDTGTTRKVAKLIYSALGEESADKPLNINRIGADELMAYDKLILGTPTLGEGQLPGLSSECQAESWEEFMPNFDEMDLSGKTVALYGLGDQVNYPDEFVDALGELYDAVDECGANIVGAWPAEGYTFNDSQALDEDGKFVGLVLDNDNQSDLTTDRIATWLDTITGDLV